MKYIASVYSLDAKTKSPEDIETRYRRYLYAVKRVAEMMKAGIYVFSPIVHCHVVADIHELPRDYKFWQDNDRHFIEISDGLIVLMMPGWERSEGITDEVAYAKTLGKEVLYLECDDYKE